MSMHEQIRGIYFRLAEEAWYRPAAPSDGCGNILLSEKELAAEGVIEDEATRYAERWVKAEDEGQYRVGCCHFPMRPALIFSVEAARSVCGGEYRVARDLLRMALAEVEERLARSE